MSEQLIFNYLQEIGCCKCCSVRYICTKFQDICDTNKYIKQEKLTEDVDDKENNQVKRFKSNPCVICLGLLQDFCINDILNHSGLEQVKAYDSDTFTCSISMPACIMVREKAVRIALQEKFPDYFTEDKEEVPMNKAWKMVIKDKLGQVLEKKFENSDVCEFSINITMDYDKNVDELEILKEIQPKMFEERKTQHRKFSGELFSRKAVQSALEKTTASLFKMFVKIPPDDTTSSLTCKTIECSHNPIYFAGRYCKYSRHLSQSPWVIDGVKTMETSVQELIFEQLQTLFGISEENIKFSSSGREDCDVRCIGKGRPFYLEISNPKKTNYSFDEFRELERKINECRVIRVRDMQLVHKNELAKIKEGEESKTKEYKALCFTQVVVTKDALDKINALGELEISQKTPIRVLHRRPLAIRKKKIYKIEAMEISSKMFLLTVETQAGTYIKEFIHGDFGRTTPSIGDIIGMEVDILALDVTAINLDWPKEISY